LWSGREADSEWRATGWGLSPRVPPLRFLKSYAATNRPSSTCFAGDRRCLPESGSSAGNQRRCSTVTDTDKFIRSTLAQLDAHLKGEKFLDGGWGLSGLLARLEACGCIVALDNRGRALQ
jgi:hypothetical protein